jgi:hypothetical protein
LSSRKILPPGYAMNDTRAGLGGGGGGSRFGGGSRTTGSGADDVEPP